MKSCFQVGVALVSAVALLGVACTGDAPTAPAGVSSSLVAGGQVITVAVAPQSATLAPAAKQQFTAIVRVRGRVINHAPVLWSSTNNSVARVNSRGLVTAVSSGVAFVRARLGLVADSAKVTVGAAVLRDVIVYATEEFGLSELALVHPDGTGRQRLTTDQFGYFAPDISPDGRRIAFANFNGIYVMNADGSGVTLVASHAFFDYAPAWSPDGARIAFRSDTPGPFGNASRIFVVNVDGTGLRQLSPDDPDPNVFYYSDDGPTWSPDGQQVVFTRSGVLQVINADGTGLTPLPNEDGAWYPDWSPNGTRIAYGRLIGGLDIAIRNADGSSPIVITSDPAQENNPRWSPDGSRLVFVRVVNGFTQLFVMNADGSGVVKLSATATTYEGTPSWSPVP